MIQTVAKTSLFFFLDDLSVRGKLSEAVKCKHVPYRHKRLYEIYIEYLKETSRFKTKVQKANDVAARMGTYQREVYRAIELMES